MMKMNNDDFNHVTMLIATFFFFDESTEFIQMMLNPDGNGHFQTIRR